MIIEGLQALAVPIDSVRPLERNPRRGNVEAIKKSLEKFGQRRPIVVRRDTGEVTAGNHLLLAAIELGWTEVAAVMVDDDEQTALAWSIADNRSHDLGGYDDAELDALLIELAEVDVGLVESAGFSVEEILTLLPEDAEDFVPYAEVEAVRDLVRSGGDRGDAGVPVAPAVPADRPVDGTGVEGSDGGVSRETPPPVPQRSTIPDTGSASSADTAGAAGAAGGDGGDRVEEPEPLRVYERFGLKADREVVDPDRVFTPDHVVLFRFGDLRARVSRAAYDALYDELMRESGRDLHEAGRLAALRLGLPPDEVEFSRRGDRYER